MYFHGIANGMVSDKVLRILVSKEIKASRKMNASKIISFNGDKYVSICSYLGEDIYSKYPNNAFYKYIMNHFCFIIDENVTIEKPIFLENTDGIDRLTFFKLLRENPDKRFSDLIDELQVKDSIFFDKVLGIGIPYHLKSINGFISLSEFCPLTEEEFSKLINQVEIMASNLNLRIYDSSSPQFLNSLGISNTR